MADTKLKSSKWGVGITVTLVLFVLLLLAAIFFSSLQRIDMVSDHYYSDSIDYEQQKARLARTQALGVDIQITHDSNRKELTVRFPESIDPQLITGTIQLYRPSNAGFDKQVTITLDTNGAQTVSAERMPRGLWKAKVDWQVGTIEYYSEKSVIFG